MAIGRMTGVARFLPVGLSGRDIALRPCGDDIGGVDGIGGVAEHVIGAGQRYEAFRVMRRGIDAAGMLDINDLIFRTVKDQQGLV